MGAGERLFNCRLLNTFWILNHVQNLVSVQRKEMNTVQWNENNIKVEKLRENSDVIHTLQNCWEDWMQKCCDGGIK